MRMCPVRQSKCDFTPLTEEDFRALQREGLVQFGPEIRKSLNRYIELHCGSRGDRFRTTASGSPPFRQIERHVAKLLEHGPAIRTMFLGNNALSPNFEREAKSVIAVLQELRRRADDTAADIGARPIRRGPKPNHWMMHFIFLVALSFRSAGGHVSTAYQKNKLSRGGPFLRVLWIVHGHLPKARQASSMRALFDLADRLNKSGELE
jgi:hypothetical protein